MKFKNAFKIERLRLLDKELELQRQIIEGHINEARDEIDKLKHKAKQSEADLEKLRNLQGQFEAMRIHQAVLNQLATISPYSTR